MLRLGARIGKSECGAVNVNVNMRYEMVEKNTDMKYFLECYAKDSITMCPLLDVSLVDRLVTNSMHSQSGRFI